MRKLFYFLVAGSAILLASCSNDDDRTGSNTTGLTITANATTVPLGSTITFTVKNNNEDVTATSTIVMQGQLLEGNTFFADEAGTYTVVATEGTLASDELTITVEGEDNAIRFDGTEFATDKSKLYYVGSDTQQNLSYWIANSYAENAEGVPNDVYLFFSTEQASDINLEYPSAGGYTLGNAGIMKLYNVQAFLNFESAVESKEELTGGKLEIREFTIGPGILTWTYDYDLTLANGKRAFGNFHGDWEYVDNSGETGDRHAVITVSEKELKDNVRRTIQNITKR